MSVRPCAREQCAEVFTTGINDDTPFVKVYVGMVFREYCCPRCASVDLTERYSPKVLP